METLHAVDFISAVRSGVPESEGNSFLLESVYGDFITFRKEDAEPWAVRYSVDDAGKVTLIADPLGVEEVRAVLSSKARANLDDSDFAYIDSKGGRHLPVHDAPHVHAALSRFGQTNFESPAAKKSAAKKVCAAASKLGVTVADDDPVAMACRSVSFDIIRSGRRQRRELAPALEHRRFEGTMEIRDVDKKGSLVTLRGTPIVYDTGYKVRDMLGEFQETMKPGSATKLLANPKFDSRFFFDHKGMPMSSTIAGTLKFEDRKGGLDTFPTIDTRSPSAMDLYVNVEAGNVRAMSIGFMTNEGGEKWDNRGENREIFELTDMPDVSAVSFPASTTTSIMLARSAFATGSAESRERLRRLYPIAKQFRSGQPVSQADGELLIRAVEALYEADDLDEETLVEAFRYLTEPEGSANKEAETELRNQRQRLALARAANAIAR